MNQKSLFHLCFLIAILFVVNVSAQNVTINQSLKTTFEAERVLSVSNTTNVEERLAIIAANPQLQQAYDEKVANSNSTGAITPVKTVTIQRNLSTDLNLNVDKSQFENNAAQRRQNFDFEQYRATIGNNVNNLKGN